MLWARMHSSLALFLCLTFTLGHAYAQGPNFTATPAPSQSVSKSPTLAIATLPFGTTFNTVQEGDPTVYNATAVADCWTTPVCVFVYTVINNCFYTFDMLSDLNDKAKSRLYRDCFCENMTNNTHQPPIDPDASPFAQCMECLRWPGNVDKMLVDQQNVKAMIFCETTDPNEYLFINDSINFASSIDPRKVLNPWSTNVPNPFQGPITTVPWMQSAYSTDPNANQIPSTSVTWPLNFTIYSPPTTESFTAILIPTIASNPTTTESFPAVTTPITATPTFKNVAVGLKPHFWKRPKRSPNLSNTSNNEVRTTKKGTSTNGSAPMIEAEPPAEPNSTVQPTLDTSKPPLKKTSCRHFPTSSAASSSSTFSP